MNRNAGAIILLLLGVITFLIAGCALPPRLPADETARIEVVVTIFPLADMVSRLGGEKVAVSCLLPAGASPHTFELTTEQVKRSSQADLLFYIGRGLDDWIVKAAAAGSDHLVMLNLAEAALQRGWAPLPDLSSGQQAGDSFNPHLWLDPLTVRDYLCPAMVEAMAEVDPQNEAYYRANLSAYQRELTALDEEIRRTLDGLPQKSFISVHAAWHYFAARYGLEQVAVISDFPGQEPSAAWISELVNLCQTHRVRVVAAEPQLSAAVAEIIAREIDGKVILLDPLGGAGLPQKESYLDLMRYNTAVLNNAFSE